MSNYILFIIIIIIIMMIFIFKKTQIDQFKNTFYSRSNQLGNTLCSYFYNYALSICHKEDFFSDNDDYKIIKYLPSFIPFNIELYEQFQENNITKNLIESKCTMCLWHCDDDWIYNLWKILRPTINKILDDAIKQSELQTKVEYPIIHFRCADVPFIKHTQYYLQKYSFFKTALEKYNFKDDKTVIIMYYFNHESDDNKIKACSQYLDNLIKYITNLGYTCKLQSKSNFEDFADLFNAPFVISTGGSFSFMSGFFGQGKFISTEHCEENYNCCKKCDDTFLKEYNIHHRLVNSYYDVDYIENNYR